MHYVLFASYRREMVEHPPFNVEFRRFLEDLKATVKGRISGTRSQDDEMCFLDTTNIELGKDWPDELQKAAGASKICLAFIYPGYFRSKWCAQEFHFFQQRGIPIIPVRWIDAPSAPAHVKRLEIVNDSLPEDYKVKGLQSIMLRGELARADYQKCVDAFADPITKAYSPNELANTNLRLANMPDWESAARAAGEPSQHSANISRTSFVFVARQGWHWKPYNNDSAKTVGALAQSVSADLGLQYEEFPCDANFDAALKTRKETNVPTVLLTDPSSVNDEAFKAGMRAYDDLYLLNCGTLLAWPEGSLNGPSPAWDEIQSKICPQKTSQPPPFHEWRSISSQLDLKNKTVAVIEGIRLSLLRKMLEPGSNVTVRKAENAQVANNAATQGIPVANMAQLTTTAGAPNS